MDIKETRRANARKLAEQFETLAKFSAAIDRSPTQVSRFIGKSPTKNIGDALARHIEAQLNKRRGWLDQNHEYLSSQILESSDVCTITREAFKIAKVLTALQQSGKISSDFIEHLSSLLESNAHQDANSEPEPELINIKVISPDANR